MRSEYIPALRRQLVEAAAQERARRRPTVAWPAVARLRPLAVATVAVAAVALAVSTVDLPMGGPPLRSPDPERIAGRPLFGGSLDPGVRYATRSLRPPISFQVDDDRWFVRDATSRHALTLERRRGMLDRPGGERAPRSFLRFGTIDRLTDPATGRDIAAPADLLGWLREHPDLRPGNSGRLTVAGMPAGFLDTTADRTPTHREPRCELLFLEAYGDPAQDRVSCSKLGPEVSLPAGMRARWIVVPMRDRPLVISIEGFKQDEFERVLPLAERIVASLRIAG